MTEQPPSPRAHLAPVLLIDAAGVLGAALMVWGAGMAWKPLGFMLAGAMLLGVAWLLGRRVAG